MSELSRWAPSVRTNTRILVSLLVRGDYEGAEVITSGRWLSRAQLAAAVQAAADALIEPPEFAFDELSITEVEGASPATFLVDFPLWTARLGRSSAVLKLRMYQGYEDGLRKEILAIEPCLP